MKEIVFLFPGNINSVRLQKFATYLSENGFVISYIGWNRYKDNVLKDDKFKSITYLLNGGGEGTKILPFLYLWFIIKLFFNLLFKKKVSEKVWFAINFETAFVLWILSKFRHVKYIYDIWDEMAISHKFPNWLVSAIRAIDRKVRRCAEFYIHVDENRFSDLDSSNNIIIYNTPFDYYSEKFDTNIEYENSFAVTGWLNNTRGLLSILKFASENKEIKFLIVGEFIDKNVEKKFNELENVEYYHFMPQNELFKLISKCRGIFSLYDPSIEINRLAASNKLYDAMMLAIPVIVNNGIKAAEFVAKNEIGYVVNYEYDSSWKELSGYDEKSITKKGNNGRRIYLSKYEFGNMLTQVFIPELNKYF